MTFQPFARPFFVLITVIASLLSAPAMSVQMSPTPEQLEQFKRLPPAQQQRLAEQYGIDLKRLNSQQTMYQNQPLEPALYPREQQLLTSPELQQMNQFALPNEDGPRLKRFGYDLFAAAPSTFAQVADVPVPTNYVLGPGDGLKVQLFGKTSEQLELTIDRDGNVDFPQ